MKRFGAVCLCLFLLCPVHAKEDAAEPTQAQLEERFQKLLTNAELTGSFSIVGKDKAPTKEKYEIVKTSKLDDTHWLFVAKWGKADVAIPLRLQVKWAGDTPIITLTDFTIPGIGTFTARVLFYGDRYAGTWQHDDVGGHLWGEIRPKSDAK